MTPWWEGAGSASGPGGIGDEADHKAGREQATSQHPVLTPHLRKLRPREMPQLKPVRSLLSDSRLGVPYPPGASRQ